jgi:hypothetical protein
VRAACHHPDPPNNRDRRWWTGWPVFAGLDGADGPSVPITTGSSSSYSASNSPAWSLIAFLRKLIGIISPPRRHLVRYAGVFDPASKGTSNAPRADSRCRSRHRGEPTLPGTQCAGQRA